VLRGHCDREGTDYDAIRKTILWSNPLEPDTAGAEFVAQMAPYADLGVEEVHVMPFGEDPVAFVRSLGEHVVGPVHAL
jgi:hypothetical protein